MTKPREDKLKKVLMIARAFPPFMPVGHSIRIVKFIKYLPALGWLPVVLTIDDQKEYETTRKVGSETLLKEIQSKVKIYRTTAGEPTLNFLEKEKEFGQRNWLAAFIVTFLGKTRGWILRNLLLPDTYISWLPFALINGRKIVNREKIDVIFTTCPPYSSALIGVCLKIITHKPLILDFRDDWIDTPWYQSKSAIIRMIFKKMESFAVKIADKVILVTKLSRKEFQYRYPSQSKEKFVFISNGCDLDEFAELKSITMPRNSRFTIVHAGSLNDSKYWDRTPLGLFKAVNNILLEQPELSDQLTLVFAGKFPEGHRRLAEEMSLSGLIKELGNLPHKEVLRLIKTADLLLAINFDGLGTLIPAKIYEYWAVGCAPILLVSTDGAARELIERRKLGFVVSPENIKGIEDIIRMTYGRYAAGSPIKISNVGIEKYDRKTLSQKLAQIFSSVVK